jgi:hypothetical protein
MKRAMQGRLRFSWMVERELTKAVYALTGRKAVASGKGRGAERVIFGTTENEVIIHDIVGYHK